METKGFFRDHFEILFLRLGHDLLAQELHIWLLVKLWLDTLYMAVRKGLFWAILIILWTINGHAMDGACTSVLVAFEPGHPNLFGLATSNFWSDHMIFELIYREERNIIADQTHQKLFPDREEDSLNVQETRLEITEFVGAVIRQPSVWTSNMESLRMAFEHATVVDLGSGIPEISIVPRLLAQAFGARRYIGVDLVIEKDHVGKEKLFKEFPDLEVRFVKVDMLKYLESERIEGPVVVLLNGVELVRWREAKEYHTRFEAMQKNGGSLHIDDVLLQLAETRPGGKSFDTLIADQDIFKAGLAESIRQFTKPGDFVYVGPATSDFNFRSYSFQQVLQLPRTQLFKRTEK